MQGTTDGQACSVALPWPREGRGVSPRGPAGGACATIRTPHEHTRVPVRRCPRHSRRPARHRHRGPRRPRQDDARRRDAPADRRLPRQPGGRGPGARFGRSRAREGHHDPRQADDRRVRRGAPQHRRHAGPRRLRRRGRALAATWSTRSCCSSTPRRGRCRRPATCSRRRMARRLPVVVAINKIDRGDARPAEVLDAIYELFIDLGADAQQIDFPVVYTNAKAGTATLDLAQPGTRSAAAPRPARGAHAATDLPARPPAPAAGDQPVGQRLRRPHGRRPRLERHDPHGPARRPSCARSRRRPTAASSRAARTILTGTVTSLTTAKGIERVDIESAGPGEIVAVAGIPEVTIGDTLTDPADPRPAAAARGRRADAGA